MALTSDDLKKIKEVLRPDFDSIHTDLKEIKTDVRTLKTDVAVLKTDVADLKEKVTDLTEYTITTLGTLLKWTDDIHKAIIGKKSSSQTREN